MTTGKLLSFHVFKSAIYREPHNPKYCAAAVFGERVSHWQCHRKPKHQYGGYGWCAQHHPPNVHARKEARYAEHRRESDARTARWKREETEAKQRVAALEAIKKIAAGHNDPAALAREVLAMLP